MDFKLSKGRDEILKEILDAKADALMAEGMDKLYQIGKCEGMQKISKNMLLWAGGAYLTSTLIKKAAEKSLVDINDKLEDLRA